MVVRFVSRLLAAGAVALAFCAVATPARAQAGSIAGKVTDMVTGQALSGANVSAISGARTAASVASGPDGTYRLTGLPAGSYAMTGTALLA